MKKNLLVGFKHISNGYIASNDEIISELKVYNGRNLLILLVHLSSYFDHEFLIKKFLETTLISFFGNSPIILGRTLEAIKVIRLSNPEVSVSVFDRRALLELIKMVLSHCDQEKGMVFDIKQMTEIGIWLLKLNDIFGEQETFKNSHNLYLPNGVYTQDNFLNIVERNFRQYYFQNLRTTNSILIFLRYERIFQIIAENENLDLEKEFKESTGESFREYLDWVLMILLMWNNFHPKYDSLVHIKAVSGAESILRDSFSPGVFKLFRNNCSLSYSDYSSHLSSRKSNGNNVQQISQTYDFESFYIQTSNFTA